MGVIGGGGETGTVSNRLLAKLRDRAKLVSTKPYTV